MSNKAVVKQDAKLALTPKLRFPEFRDADGWREGRIADIADVLQGYGFPESYQGQTAGEYPFYKVSDISNTLAIGKVFIKGAANHITEGVMKKLKAKPIPEGTTIFAKIGEAIRSNRRAITTKPCLIDNNVAGVKRVEGKSTDLFMYFTMETISLIDYSGGAVPSVNKSAIENISVRFPKIEEQQKIAECLSTLDEVIAAQSQKLDALKTHKKGLMQQLFPREGETLPRIRFPEFLAAPKWVAMPLRELLPITSSKRVHESDWTTEGVPFYRAREIVALHNRQKISPLFINEELYKRNAKASGEIAAGHLLVTGVGSIGVPYLVADNDRFYFKDGNIIWLKNDGARLLGKYLFYIYQTRYVQNQITTMAGVGTVGTYTIDNANKTIVAFPEDRNEQQRIANCLTSLDDLITAHSAKLSALKTHKKGLMQQLFPSPEEVEA